MNNQKTHPGFSSTESRYITKNRIQEFDSFFAGLLKQKLSRFASLVLLTLFFIMPALVSAKEHKKEKLSELSLQELMELEVTVATRSPKQIKHAPAIASVITAEQIKNMGARNLTDVLITIPGFGLQTSQGWARNEIEVRGISGVRNSEKVLVMLNGHKLNDPFFGGATTVTDDFPLDNVKQIEIIRGPGSALYGANAFTAVINIVTKAPEDIDGLLVNLGRGDFDTSRLNVLFGNAVNDIKFSTNLNYFDTDSQKRFIEQDPLTGVGASEAPGYTNNHRERYDIQLNLDYKNLNFMSRFIDMEHGALVGPRDHLGDDNLYKFNEFYSEISHKYDMAKDLVLVNRLYYDRFDIDFFFELFPEGTVLPPGLPPGAGTTFPDGVLYQGKAVEHIYGYSMQVDYKLARDNIFTTGLELEYIRQTDVTTKANFEPRPLLPTDPDFRVIPSTQLEDVSDFANFNQADNRTVAALYVQDDWKLNKQVWLTLGVRGDHYDDVGGSINPRAAIVYSPTSDIDVKLLYGTAFRAPNFEELYNQNNKGVIGNPDLDPEEVQTAQIGLEYSLSPNSHLSLNGFYSDFTNLIALGPPDPDNSNLRMFQNLSDVESWGGEAELKISFGKNNYMYANYSYQRSTDQSTDSRLANAPEHRGNIGANVSLNNYLNVHLHTFISGERPRDKGDPRSSLSGYALFDLAIIAKNFYKNFEVRATIHNLLDKEYVNPAVALPNDYPQQGRDVFIEVSYKF